MADPAPRSNSKWLWPLVIALLAVLLLIWFISPSGDRDDPGVEDPIVTGELADPAAEEGAGPLGQGLPGEGAPDPAAGGEPVEGRQSAPEVDTQPTEAVAVPPPAPVDEQGRPAEG